MKLEGKILGREFKPLWKQVKKCYKKGSEEKRLGQYRKKEMQSEIYKNKAKKSNIWLEQILTPRKTSPVMSTRQQMVETRAWKEVRSLTENIHCRLCKEQQETVQHFLAGCKMLSSSEYLVTHNRTLMVIAVAWRKEQNLLDQNVKWYQEKWNRYMGHGLENSPAKLVWDFEFNLRKTTTSRRSHLMLEEKQTKIICDMACLQ